MEVLPNCIDPWQLPAALLQPALGVSRLLTPSSTAVPLPTGQGHAAGSRLVGGVQSACGEVLRLCQPVPAGGQLPLGGWMASLAEAMRASVASQLQAAMQAVSTMQVG